MDFSWRLLYGRLPTHLALNYAPCFHIMMRKWITCSSNATFLIRLFLWCVYIRFGVCQVQHQELSWYAFCTTSFIFEVLRMYGVVVYDLARHLLVLVVTKKQNHLYGIQPWFKYRGPSSVGVWSYAFWCKSFYDFFQFVS